MKAPKQITESINTINTAVSIFLFFIYKICVANQIDVLKISVGDILLDGYAYGFIGGCCGLVSKDTLAFSGNVGLHRDFENMRDFTRNHHVELYSLTNEKLYDIGGILPIKEIGN